MTQQQYKRNLRLINWLSAMNASSFFVAFAVPFWLGAGLTQQKIYLLQGIFTVVMIVLEIPTGMIADRVGRRRSLIAAGLLASIGFGFYSLAHGFWQFALAETMLALGISLNSGTVQAMRHESTIASGNGESGRKTAGTAQAYGMMAAAISAALSGIIVKYLGLRATMLFDAGTYLLATAIAFRMSEPPHLQRNKQARLRTHLPLLISLAGLIGLFALLSEATHIPVHLNARILQAANINVGWFGAVFAGLNIAGAIAAHSGHRLEDRLGEKRTAVMLVTLGFVAYLATGLLPAGLASISIFGFAVMRGLNKPLMDHALNSRIHDDSARATINSCSTLVARVLYLVAGPLIGGVVDSHGAQSGYLVTGIAFGALSAGALWASRNLLERR